MKLNKNYQSMVVTGVVADVNPVAAAMVLNLLSGDKLEVSVAKKTWYEVLRNVGDESRDRVLEPKDEDVEAAIGKRGAVPDSEKEMWDAKRKLLKYIKIGTMVSIRGVFSQTDEKTSFSARRVVLMHSLPHCYGWEETHWWLQQINTLLEQWMDVLFRDKREITENDFAEFYRTNIDFLGNVTTNDTQECATMSRFLYGLSSSYMLTGNDRAYSAAKACAKYMINAFASMSHDQLYCFWNFGRKHGNNSVKTLISSKNDDDKGSFALYEQIYVLAGLSQYYRLSQDTEILFYIKCTISAFLKFYYDEHREGDACFTGKGGFFSHIDPVTMRPDSPSLNDNMQRKNWNSIGDHIPAYLINILLAIDPLPDSGNDQESWEEMRQCCRKILYDCVTNILDHFPPNKDEGSVFVNERFNAAWDIDYYWGWQQNRGIVGHNLKISWNLTRCGHYYKYLASQEHHEASDDEQRYIDIAQRCYDFAMELGKNMAEVGVDLIRGGIFDALERCPQNGMSTEFAWETTKDFWQQEQAILAYYIMSGIENNCPDKIHFLELARYCAGFWNLYFVDQDNGKIYFRTTESGMPVVQDGYGIQGGHAIAGYHSFELNFLAHLYIRTYVPQTGGGDDSFCITFKPCKNSITTLNVLPDFFRPDELKMIGIKFNGMPQPIKDKHKFQIDIGCLSDATEVVVEFLPIRREGGRKEKDIHNERSIIDNINFTK